MQVSLKQSPAIEKRSAVGSRGEQRAANRVANQMQTHREDEYSTPAFHRKLAEIDSEETVDGAILEQRAGSGSVLASHLDWIVNGRRLSFRV